FVGDVFGSLLALEALLAFFLESTFLGLWIFGWDRLSRGKHLAMIWLAAAGTLISSIFIIAANSWMQNPVGATYKNGRAELVDFGAVLTNPIFLTQWPHTVIAAFMVAGGFIAGIAGWHLAKLARQVAPDAEDVSAFRTATKLGAVVMLVAGLLIIISGDLLGKQMTRVQPMKMAAAEALYTTETNASFSLFTIGSLDGSKEVFAIKVPGVLSILAGESTVKGINDIKADYAKNGFTQSDGGKEQLQKEFAGKLATMGVTPTPNIPVSYWTFRIMMGLGLLTMLIGAWMLWVTRKGAMPKPGPLWTGLMWGLPLLPLFANSFGWIFTEMGRQPWIVAGVMPTALAVSPTVTVGEVWFSMVVYTLLYGVLAVVEVGLMLTYIRKGLPDVAPVEQIVDEDAPLSFAY
ncbi:MAG: cytochrome ubiquinol oxidase subunit I, partial [Actinobacteria bacterium]|nr:cytochrome ubiquinol oxidase subunit I [Actinomycetota bacterium]